MDLARLFSLSSLTVMPFWLMMALLPGWKWTTRIIRSPLIAAAPALLYTLLVLPRFVELMVSLSNPTLAGIAQVLGTPEGAMIGWVHFLAFDLLVGRWVYFDSRRRSIHPVLMALILFMILMLGPLGFLLYMVVRAVAPRRV